MTYEEKRYLRTGGEAFANDHNHGMTLLDWFAGQALAQLVKEYESVEAAHQAYRYAAAMVAERHRLNQLAKE